MQQRSALRNKLILNTDPGKSLSWVTMPEKSCSRSCSLWQGTMHKFQVYRQILIYPALYNTYTATAALPQLPEERYGLSAYCRVKMQDYLNLCKAAGSDQPLFCTSSGKRDFLICRNLILTAELILFVMAKIMEKKN